MTTNPFELLDIPPTFDVDNTLLTMNYIEAQEACHPDRLLEKGAAAIAVATARSSLVNGAYATLKNPILRARALIAMLDLDVDIESPPQAVLMASMEEREEAENAKSKRAFKAVLQQRLTQNLAQLSHAFECRDVQKIAHYYHLCLYQYKLTKDLQG